MELYKRYILPILLTSFCLTSLEAGEPLIKTSYVYARGGESLRELLEYQVGIPQNVLDQDGYFEKIKRWNSSLEDPTSLVPGERVYVEIPYRVVLVPRRSSPIDNLAMGNAAKTVPQKLERKTASSEKETNQMVAAIKESDDKERKDRWSYSLFYALSRGSFQESILNSDITTKSTQDSPFTLGVSTFKKLHYDWNYSGSLYVSKLDGGLSDQNESVSLPWEYGLNSYIGYQRESWPVEVYTGIDHERFSSYNTEELPSGEPLSTREHTLTFLTLGVSKKFEWFGKQFLAKASYSSSVMSSQSRESKVNPQEFKGTKFILYLNMKASKDWFYHGFYKQHDLEGATSLHIARLGLGFGYSF